MKKLFISFVAAVFIFGGAAISGFYPVALVDGAPIFFKTWQKAEKAAIRFIAVQGSARGVGPVDFYAAENADLLLGAKRDTLTFLIEDKILQQEGETAVEDFEAASAKKVAEVFQESVSIQQGAELLYGLSSDDFNELVLLPQARRDVLSEAFAAQGRDFEQWFREVRKKKNVRLLFVPFVWNGEVVQ